MIGLRIRHAELAILVCRTGGQCRYPMSQMKMLGAVADISMYAELPPPKVPLMAKGR